jgi:hypothetical protein
LSPAWYAERVACDVCARRASSRSESPLRSRATRRMTDACMRLWYPIRYHLATTLCWRRLTTSRQ